MRFRLTFKRPAVARTCVSLREAREIEASRAANAVFQKKTPLPSALRRTTRRTERRNAFHGVVIIASAVALSRSCQFVVGVEYCVLFIANVTSSLLLNVTHQRAMITICRVKFSSWIKYTAIKLLALRLDTDLLPP